MRKYFVAVAIKNNRIVTNSFVHNFEEELSPREFYEQSRKFLDRLDRFFQSDNDAVNGRKSNALSLMELDSESECSDMIDNLDFIFTHLKSIRFQF